MNSSKIKQTAKIARKVAIEFSLATNWLRGEREFPGPITEHCKTNLRLLSTLIRKLRQIGWEAVAPTNLHTLCFTALSSKLSLQRCLVRENIFIINEKFLQKETRHFESKSGCTKVTQKIIYHFKILRVLWSYKPMHLMNLNSKFQNGGEQVH